MIGNSWRVRDARDVQICFCAVPVFPAFEISFVGFSLIEETYSFLWTQKFAAGK